MELFREDNIKEKIEGVAQKYAKKYHVWRNQVGKLQFEIELLKQPIEIDREIYNDIIKWLNHFINDNDEYYAISHERELAKWTLKQLGVKE
jgi:hypothetical protein